MARLAQLAAGDTPGSAVAPTPPPRPVAAPAPVQRSAPAASSKAPALAEAWPRVLDAASAQQELAAHLALAKPLRVEANQLVLGLPPGHEFQRDQLIGERFRAPTEELIAQVYGERWRLRCICDPSVPAPAAAERRTPEPRAADAPPSSAVGRVMDAFDGRNVPPEEIDR